MSKLLFLMIFFNFAQTSIEIIKPKSLREKILSYDNQKGFLTSSTSNFGDIPYDQMNYMQVILPPDDNIDGCLSLTLPSMIESKTNIAWLLKRGHCNFSKKAYNCQESGAFSVLVYDNQLDENISSIIPVGDQSSLLKRQHFKVSFVHYSSQRRRSDKKRNRKRRRSVYKHNH